MIYRETRGNKLRISIQQILISYEICLQDILLIVPNSVFLDNKTEHRTLR